MESEYELKLSVSVPDSTEKNIYGDNDKEIFSESDDFIPTTPVSNTDSINQLTLELLLNNTCYKKYMSKVQPDKQTPNKIEDLELYFGNIQSLIDSMLENALETGHVGQSHGSSDPLKEIHNTFRHFLVQSIHYFKDLANIKVKKLDNDIFSDNGEDIDFENKDIDELNPIERENLTFVKVKKTRHDLSLNLSNLSPLAMDIPKPPILKRQTNYMGMR